MTRLGLASLRSLGRAPGLDRGDLRTGVVHLGAGAFFRAHGAVLTEDAMLATGETAWGVCAVTGRSPSVWKQLAPQDGLFTVSERGRGSRPARLVSSVRETLAGPRDPWAVVERIADPSTRIVTLTVTEKGYRAHPRTGRPDARDPVMRGDLSGAPPLTPVGQIAHGLELRRRRETGPLTVLSCDNLSQNGDRLAAQVSDFVATLWTDGPLRDWMRENVTFPNTMVDRMVPATTPEDLDRVEREFGLRDEAAVVAEPFLQWVVEDRFATERPRWEEAGAVLTDDVRPWEETKLRVLNAGHSLAAYLGLAAGHRTIAECMTDDVISTAVRRLAFEEALPALELPGGLDGPSYAEAVLGRFANPALGHTTVKVGADGSQKLGPRLLSTAEAVLSGGGEPRWSALAVAAWVRHVVGSGPDLEDPLAVHLHGLVSDTAAPGAVDVALLGSEVLPRALGSNEVFADLVGHWYGILASEDRRALALEVNR